MEFRFRLEYHHASAWHLIAHSTDCQRLCDRAMHISRLLSMRRLDIDVVRVVRGREVISCFRTEDWRRGRKSRKAQTPLRVEAA